MLFALEHEATNSSCDEFTQFENYEAKHATIMTSSIRRSRHAPKPTAMSPKRSRPAHTQRNLPTTPVGG